MIPYKTKAEIMVDSECKRYFNFDGVMAGVLYLIHKYMPDHFQSRCYETFYEEWKLRCHDDNFVKDWFENHLIQHRCSTGIFVHTSIGTVPSHIIVCC